MKALSVALGLTFTVALGCSHPFEGTHNPALPTYPRAMAATVAGPIVLDLVDAGELAGDQVVAVIARNVPANAQGFAVAVDIRGAGLDPTVLHPGCFYDTNGGSRWCFSRTFDLPLPDTLFRFAVRRTFSGPWGVSFADSMTYLPSRYLCEAWAAPMAAAYHFGPVEGGKGWIADPLPVEYGVRSVSWGDAPLADSLSAGAIQ